MLRITLNRVLTVLIGLAIICLCVQLWLRGYANHYPQNGQSLPVITTTQTEKELIYTSPAGDKIYEFKYHSGMIMYVAEARNGRIISITRF